MSDYLENKQRANIISVTFLRNERRVDQKTYTAGHVPKEKYAQITRGHGRSEVKVFWLSNIVS